MLALRDLNIYYGESHILRNVSFAVGAGEVVCLMGRNGVGKTTTTVNLAAFLALSNRKVSATISARSPPETRAGPERKQAGDWYGSA